MRSQLMIDRIPALFLFGALLIAVLTATPAAAESPAGIHVVGSGEVKVVPDMARLSLKVRREGADAAALKRELDEVTAAVLELTETLDIERRDVTAASVNVYPGYRPVEGQEPERFLIASRNIEVTVRDLEQIAALINGALERGANGIGGVQLDASNRADLERQAMDLAIQDAVREARQMAEQFDVELGVLRNASASSHQV